MLHPRGRLIVAGPPRHRIHASASRGTATKDCEQDPVVVISAETRVVGVRARDEMTCARQWYKRAPGVMQMTRRHLASSHHRPSVRDRIARRQSSFHFAPSHPYRNCLCLRSSAVPDIGLWPANPSSLRCAFDSRCLLSLSCSQDGSLAASSSASPGCRSAAYSSHRLSTPRNAQGSSEHLHREEARLQA